MLENKAQLVSTAQDAKDALTELPVLADALFRLFEGKYGLLCAIIMVFLISWYLLFKVSPSGLLVYHQTRRRSRFEALEKYLSNSQANDQSCSQAIRDIYEAECFEQATGIYAERTKRVALISLYGKVNDVASWRTIRTAQDFLEFNQGGSATIRPLNRHDRYMRLSHNICGKGTIFFGSLVFIFTLCLPGNRFLRFFEGFGIYIVLLAVGAFFLRETMPYECAEKIRTRLQSHPHPVEPAVINE